VSEDSAERIREAVDAIFRTESRRVLATLIRLLGDFDLAEEAMQEAFSRALEQWPVEGMPASPRAWLISTGRFRAIDSLRRRTRFDASLHRIAERLNASAEDPAPGEDEGLEDDRLRLIFTCCHPALPPDAQVARAFLSRAPAVAQRIVRAKAKIREARIPYQVPERPELNDRVDVVLRVVYLVFNEGYSATSGPELMRADLSAEAIRLGRLLAELLPEPEVEGLLALMLLQESRRAARMSSTGELVLLDQQDRSLWDRQQIAEGVARVQRALLSRRFGPFTLQAAIAAVHAESPSAEATNWAEIVGLYDVLMRVDPSPIVELNRAVAVAMRDGPAAGLALIDAILSRGELEDYHFAHSARAELYRRLGRTREAGEAYYRALTLAKPEPARRFLQRRIREMAGG